MELGFSKFLFVFIFSGHLSFKKGLQIDLCKGILMVDKEVKADLAPLIEILNSFDLTGCIERKREVEHIIEFCRKCSRKDIIKDGYSMKFLIEGVGAYLWGLDEAAIYYSSLAVELILLSRLTNKYGQFSLDKMNRFKLLIKNCKKEGILDEERGQDADNLRLLRDCYIHYDNLLNYSSAMSRKLIASFSSADNKLTEEDRKNIENLKSTFSIFEKAYPFSKARILSVERTSFLSRRIEEYAKWLQSQGLTLIDVLRIGFTKEENMRYRRVRQQKFDALTSLQWSLQLLQFLSP